MAGPFLVAAHWDLELRLGTQASSRTGNAIQHPPSKTHTYTHHHHYLHCIVMGAATSICSWQYRDGGGVEAEMSLEIAQLPLGREVWMVHQCVYSCACMCVYMCVCVRHILSPLVVFCKSLSHPKPLLLSDDLIDLHDSIRGTVKKTGSSGEMRERTAPSSSPK